MPQSRYLSFESQSSNYRSSILYESPKRKKESLINYLTRLLANYSGKFTGVYNGHEFFLNFHQ